jgi:plastocyanin
MRTLVVALTVLASALTLGGSIALADRDDDRGKNMQLLDDCDPGDVTWGEIGGCFRKDGTVTRGEFFAGLSSPFSIAVVGHPAWSIGPSFMTMKSSGTIRVTNTGGRDHTFTRVAQFGAGSVPNPALNKGLTLDPGPQGCTTSVVIPPGGMAAVGGLAPGDYKFQCCIHPWMRAQVTVEP